MQTIFQTIENTREADETMVQPDDEEVIADETLDEFAGGDKRVVGLSPCTSTPQ